MSMSHSLTQNKQLLLNLLKQTDEVLDKAARMEQNAVHFKNQATLLKVKARFGNGWNGIGFSGNVKASLESTHDRCLKKANEKNLQAYLECIRDAAIWVDYDNKQNPNETVYQSTLRLELIKAHREHAEQFIINAGLIENKQKTATIPGKKSEASKTPSTQAVSGSSSSSASSQPGKEKKSTGKDNSKPKTSALPPTSPQPQSNPPAAQATEGTDLAGLKKLVLANIQSYKDKAQSRFKCCGLFDRYRKTTVESLETDITNSVDYNQLTLLISNYAHYVKMAHIYGKRAISRVEKSASFEISDITVRKPKEDASFGYVPGKENWFFTRMFKTYVTRSGLEKALTEALDTLKANPAVRK